MKKGCFFLMIVLLAQIGVGQSFQLVEPDKDEIMEALTHVKERMSTAQMYLEKNYGAMGEPDSIVHYDDGSSPICAFQQTYQPNIMYKQEACMEVGLNETLIFPKVSTEALHRFIDLLYSDEENVWSTETIYEPKEGGAGCYYEIIQKEDCSIIDSYCGC